MGFFNFFKKNSNSQEEVLSVNKKEFQHFLKKEKQPQIVVVRTASEYKTGHIKNAANIDIFSPKFLSKSLELPQDQPLFVYCKSGGRSLKAAKRLSKNGFNKIINLKGGYNSWIS